MPVFGACFLPALFAVMQRYKDCVNEQKEMPAFIPFLASIYIMYARTFLLAIYNAIISFLLLVLLCFPFFSTLLIFCEFAPNRPAARKFANYEAFKIPLSALVQTFVLIFWLCILLLSFVPSSLVGCSDRSQRLFQPRFLVLS